MKNCIVPILLLITSSVFGQSKIEGFGKFKLQKTTFSYLDTFLIEQQYDKIKIYSFDDYLKMRNKKYRIAEIIPDTIKKYNSPPFTHSCPDTRVVYIPSVTISEITFNNMYLTFFKNVLVNINTDYTPEIVEALELKYGKPEIEKKEKQVQCTVKLTGNNITYTEKTYYKTWENGEIRCIAVLGDYYDSKCEKKILSYITLSTGDIWQQITECDLKINELIENRQKNEKKKLLDDF